MIKKSQIGWENRKKYGQNYKTSYWSDSTNNSRCVIGALSLKKCHSNIILQKRVASNVVKGNISLDERYENHIDSSVIKI